MTNTTSFRIGADGLHSIPYLKPSLKPCFWNPHNLPLPPKKFSFTSTLSQWCVPRSYSFLQYSEFYKRLSPSIFLTPAMNIKPSSTNLNVLCNHPTHILWTSSAQVCLQLDSVKCVMHLRSYCSCFTRFSSFFPGCFAITTVFSHAQTVVVCPSCTSVLCQPTGGKARLTEGALPSCFIPTSPTNLFRFSGCSFRRKN